MNELLVIMFCYSKPALQNFMFIIHCNIRITDNLYLGLHWTYHGISKVIFWQKIYALVFSSPFL